MNVGKVTEVLGDDAPVGSLDLVLNPANMEKLAHAACISLMLQPR